MLCTDPFTLFVHVYINKQSIFGCRLNYDNSYFWNKISQNSNMFCGVASLVMRTYNQFISCFMTLSIPNLGKGQMQNSCLISE